MEIILTHDGYTCIIQQTPCPTGTSDDIYRGYISIPNWIGFCQVMRNYKLSDDSFGASHGITHRGYLNSKYGNCLGFILPDDYMIPDNRTVMDHMISELLEIAARVSTLHKQPAMPGQVHQLPGATSRLGRGKPAVNCYQHHCARGGCG